MLIKNYLASTLTNTRTAAAATHAANDGLLPLPTNALAAASNDFQLLRGHPPAQRLLTHTSSLHSSPTRRASHLCTPALSEGLIDENRCRPRYKTRVPRPTPRHRHRHRNNQRLQPPRSQPVNCLQAPLEQ